VVRQAQLRGIKLAFVILSTPAEKAHPPFTAMRYEGVLVVPLPDSKIAELLESRGSIETFLRDQVRAAQETQ